MYEMKYTPSLNRGVLSYFSSPNAMHEMGPHSDPISNQHRRRSDPPEGT